MDVSLAVWQKSSFSNSPQGDCIEVASNLDGIIALRDSKNPDGPVLLHTPHEWKNFLAGVINRQMRHTNPH